MLKQVFYIITVGLIISCSESPKDLPKIDVKQLQDNLIEANKIALSKEIAQIEVYIKENNLDITKTQTGLKYQIYKDLEGEKIQEKQKAVIKYTVTLLDGTECYSTKTEVEEFTVGKDYVESGLHEGIQFMSTGDKAIIIIPSHLAHGLVGDMKKIPFRSTIVYDIELIAIK